MGFPMARRLIEAGHRLVVCDTRKEAVDRLIALGAQAASSPKDIADRVGRLWEVVIRDMGAESDFTSAIQPIEKAAGVVVSGSQGAHAAK